MEGLASFREEVRMMMNGADVYSAFKEHISWLHGDTSITPIPRGYSSDKKYEVLKEGQKYVLRTFDYNQVDAKKAEYDVLMKMQEVDVNCSKPVKFGSIPDMGIGYMILTYVEGNDASVELLKLSSADQYRIGLEAGEELRKIHQYKAPDHIADWYDRKVAKHQRYIEAYTKLDNKVAEDHRVISFIDANLHLMKDRPNLFQHDDFHLENMIIRENRLAGIIDFNRWDWGDPVHEFLKVGIFSSELSIPFSIGQIRGYHHNEEPNELFWRLYSLYLAMCVFSSAVWVIRFQPEATDEMMKKVNRVLEDHSYFEQMKPKWYVEG